MQAAIWTKLASERKRTPRAAGRPNCAASPTAFWPVVVGGGGAAAAHRVGWLVDEAVHGALADAGGMSRAAFLAQSYVSVILAHFAAAQVWYRGGLPCASPHAMLRDSRPLVSQPCLPVPCCTCAWLLTAAGMCTTYALGDAEWRRVSCALPARGERVHSLAINCTGGRFGPSAPGC